MTLLSLLVACTGADKVADTAATDGPSTDGLVATEACGELRMQVVNDALALALSVGVGVMDSAASGTPVSVDASVGDAGLVAVAERAPTTDDPCSTYEAFPPMATPDFWRATSGALSVTFAPSAAWPADGDWTYDGTVIGDATIEVNGLVLSPFGAETTTLRIENATWTAPLAVPDLPA